MFAYVVIGSHVVRQCYFLQHHWQYALVGNI